MQNIWQATKPLFVQAPMEDVSDSVFRQVLLHVGTPDIFFTEFCNVDGLSSRGHDKVVHRLQHRDIEQPLIAQIWGEQPENYAQVAQNIASGNYGNFAGIDINMGCPERGIVARGCCAGLINHPDRAIEIIRAVQNHAGDLPVSVKTRCGTKSWITEEWTSILLQQNLAALTIHGRIAKEMSNFPARWEEIAKVVALRNQIAPSTKIIGNGDVESFQDGLDKVATYGVDGVMIGRGIFRNLWVFNQSIDPMLISPHERIHLLAEHIKLWEQTWGNTKNFNTLKKFYKVYLNGFDGASELRAKLMEFSTGPDTLAFLASLDTN
jgi:tRNA-dihydrouridine synthase